MLQATSQIRDRRPLGSISNLWRARPMGYSSCRLLWQIKWPIVRKSTRLIARSIARSCVLNNLDRGDFASLLHHLEDASAIPCRQYLRGGRLRPNDQEVQLWRPIINRNFNEDRNPVAQQPGHPQEECLQLTVSKCTAKVLEGKKLLLFSLLFLFYFFLFKI